MSDDSFIREVDDELRQDRAKDLWRRYGIWVIAGAIAIVAGTAGIRGYQYWVDSQASASGDAFLQAMTLANEGKSDEALAALADLEKDGYGSYPVLARMRAATVRAEKGDFDAAVKGFDAVAADSAIADAVRDMARLRAAFILVDNGSRSDVATRVEQLTPDANPLRHSAREALALADWKAGNASDALKLFEQISADETAPRNARQRAELMAELIRGSGGGS
ncbi:MAG: tetratricopeptide repeat protein [Rhizobiaceae bacterium]